MLKIAFTGGGTAGHIYPGLAVADELKNIAKEKNLDVSISWIGCSKGMDRKIVTNAVRPDGAKSADMFYGIPSGKLRRYFSLQNFFDLFKIAGGFFASFFILLKLKPSLLFSKGGFVSVPPCIAAKILHIPVFTHECDFTPGLANRINAKSATKMLLSYEETKRFLSEQNKQKAIVTGNPVRPVFYEASAEKGREFLKMQPTVMLSEVESSSIRSGDLGTDDSSPGAASKPVLLVLGGSSGAKQINSLVAENLDFLCEHFTVVHQTGMLNTDEKQSEELKEKYGDSYKPFDFIYGEMPDVLSCADVVLSRAGANSIWECAVMFKPMVLIPLCGNGTRGDQVDNAKFFMEKGAAKVLLGEEATSENVRNELFKLTSVSERGAMSDALKKMVGEKRPARIIAELLLNIKY